MPAKGAVWTLKPFAAQRIQAFTDQLIRFGTDVSAPVRGHTLGRLEIDDVFPINENQIRLTGDVNPLTICQADRHREPLFRNDLFCFSSILGGDTVSGKETMLPSSPPLRTGLETLASSGSSLCNAPYGTRFHHRVFLAVNLAMASRMQKDLVLYLISATF